jgi:hypothetical protein
MIQILNFLSPALKVSFITFFWHLGVFNTSDITFSGIENFLDRLIY